MEREISKSPSPHQQASIIGEKHHIKIHDIRGSKEYTWPKKKEDQRNIKQQLWLQTNLNN